MIPEYLVFFKIYDDVGLYCMAFLPLVFYPLLWFLRRQRRSRLFLLIAVFPFLFFAVSFSSVYCGWHYRMELRDRFASDGNGGINLSRMPSEILREYAARDYHPRKRDLYGTVVWSFFLFPLFLLPGAVYVFFGKKEKFSGYSARTAPDLCFRRKS